MRSARASLRMQQKYRLHRGSLRVGCVQSNCEQRRKRMRDRKRDDDELNLLRARASAGSPTRTPKSAASTGCLRPRSPSNHLSSYFYGSLLCSNVTDTKLRHCLPSAFFSASTVHSSLQYILQCILLQY
jgi:hypothetical protein